MHIQWLGQSCFKFTEKEKTLVIDPYDKDSGLKPPRAKADVLVLSEQKSEGESSVSGDYFRVATAGEYERDGIFIYGKEIRDEGSETFSLVYRIHMDDVSVGHLTNLHRPLREEEVEFFENIDVLCVPVGGGDSLNAKQAMEAVQAIEPRVVIPMRYNIDGLKGDYEPVDAFLKLMGAKPQAQPKIIVKKKDLPQEETQVMVLEPSNS